MTYLRGIITFSENSGEFLKDAMVIKRTGAAEDIDESYIAVLSEHVWLGSAFGKPFQPTRLERS
ncbi:hypothetical protein COY52_09505 [Candidatus Desantisbacteria bacterium CG_4_10_14_0_8_um_filter_48_22]|uniref:Uncharacterized protein n=1 Tax=Candidatus Desantisbacteria bacterium CG_4_10_14_0_8_um_filter_48_22 TaxID=1974543 RepID=A0A2M7S7P4_9BACT|nr:MAG: hypothetical protein COY52_09505 [Candidatus Desantisbacteria bacterium CG_4_10_14_0_8_um_filter_48_22]